MCIRTKDANYSSSKDRLDGSWSWLYKDNCVWNVSLECVLKEEMNLNDCLKQHNIAWYVKYHSLVPIVADFTRADAPLLWMKY